MDATITPCYALVVIPRMKQIDVVIVIEKNSQRNSNWSYMIAVGFVAFISKYEMSEHHTSPLSQHHSAT